MNIEYVPTTAFTAGASLLIVIGVTMADVALPVMDPGILVARDLREDWMYLASAAFDPGLLINLPAAGNESVRRIDIKAMRKADMEVDPQFLLKVVRIDTGAAPAAGVLTARGTSSVLWSQTRR